MTHFNPRPREEGDVGVTSRRYGPNIISIHALAKRATPMSSRGEKLRNHFNPRPREEGDDNYSLSDLAAVTISIHALAKRATSSSGKVRRWSYYISIHALAKRATGNSGQESHERHNFNPRPREEGDGASASRRACPDHFNPRPREEGDNIFDFSLAEHIRISIHALAKRATCF